MLEIVLVEDLRLDERKVLFEKFIFLFGAAVSEKEDQKR